MALFWITALTYQQNLSPNLQNLSTGLLESVMMWPITLEGFGLSAKPGDWSLELRLTK
jgi:hypothetical protein